MNDELVVLKQMAPYLIVLHGGAWNKEIYKGGTKDYIPLPCAGISFIDLLSKLEVRIKKDTSTHTFDIHAVVKAHEGETMRLKVTDEFEWSCLLEMMDLPVIYVDVCAKTIVPIESPHVNEYDFCFDVATLDTPCESSSALKGATSRWVIAGAEKQALIQPDDMPIQIESMPTNQCVCGAVFRSKNAMLSAIHSFHMKNSLEFRTLKSDLKKYYVVCKFETTCVFSLRSKSFGKAWKIYELKSHSCTRDIRNCAEPRVTSRAIAEYVGPNLTEDGFTLRPCDIRGQMLREFGIRLNYATALSGRNRALKALHGGHEESFKLLASYLYMLEFKNPGSVVALQTRPDGSFQYCFFSLSASIRAFRACRPVLVIDATHLKGMYKGVLFVATTKDANEQILPLAFGIGDKEESDSWIWFLQNLQKSLGNPKELLIVSDQHRSIKNAVEVVYPTGTPHGFCTYHIQGNLKSCPGWKESVIDIFHASAKAYKVEDFEEHMQNLGVACPSAHAKLIGIGPIRWANCKCPVRRYAYGTSNAVESLNGRLKWGRKLPVTSLLEYIRNLVQAWFYQRRTIAGERENEVSEFAEKRLGFAISKGNSYRVQPISDMKFNIISDTISGTNSNIVDLHIRECSCKVFQMDLFPCSHATAAIRFKRQSPVAYVHAYYSTNVWREIYASEIMPVPDPSEWHIPHEIASRVVGTPPNPKQAGRPKTKRVPSGVSTKEGPREDLPTKDVSKEDVLNKEVECSAPSKEPRVCGRCHVAGHYKSTCTASIQVSTALRVSDSKPSSKRKREPKKCGICGILGHTRQSCKDPNRFD